MKSFTVFEPPAAPADRLDRAEAMVFVKEGFSWSAAFLTPFWLPMNGLWIELLVYLALVGGLEAVLHTLGINQGAISTLILAVHIIIGFEADTLRRWKLARAGWRMVGSVAGSRLVDCERRFFEAWLPQQPLVTPDSFTTSRFAAQSDVALQSTSSAVPPVAPGGRRERRSGWRSAFDIGSRG